MRLAVVLLGQWIMRACFGDLWPCSAVLVVELEPTCEIITLVSVCSYSISRAFWLANAAVDAFIWVYNQHVVALVETIHWAYADAVHVFAFDAVVYDHVGHD